jgi:hypothetical protein
VPLSSCRIKHAPGSAMQRCYETQRKTNPCHAMLCPNGSEPRAPSDTKLFLRCMACTAVHNMLGLTGATPQQQQHRTMHMQSARQWWYKMPDVHSASQCSCKFPASSTAFLKALTGIPTTCHHCACTLSQPRSTHRGTLHPCRRPPQNRRIQNHCHRTARPWTAAAIQHRQ